MKTSTAALLTFTLVSIFSASSVANAKKVALACDEGQVKTASFDKAFLKRATDAREDRGTMALSLATCTIEIEGSAVRDPKSMLGATFTRVSGEKIALGKRRPIVRELYQILGTETYMKLSCLDATQQNMTHLGLSIQECHSEFTAADWKAEAEALESASGVREE